MKSLKTLLIIFSTVLFALSCQKEYSIEDAVGTATGTLKADNFGDCLPSSVNGIYKADSTLGAQNFIDVQVNTTAIGAYTISTDTVNGFSFKAIGSFTAVGLNTVRLKGAGKPIAANGPYLFTVKFGLSTCIIEVDVLGAGSAIASYSFQNTAGACSGALVDGIYKQNVALNFNNTVTLKVNVTTPGAYSISTTTANGIFFSASGIFATAGTGQLITLEGQATPLATGNFNFTAGATPNSCIFSVTVTSGTSTAAAYTFAGAPGNCTGVVLAGIYQAGLPTNTTNTATLAVAVSTAGTYNITTTAQNGVSFSGSGSFTTTTTNVTLTATGTPLATSTFSYTATGAGATSCAFPITYIAASPPAVFTLAGAPTACTPATIAGNYNASNALTAANTVTMQANVTTIGSYSIITPAVNGMTFTASGIFAATGAQTVTLIGSGTPAASGTFTFTPQVGTSSCTFNIVVVGSSSTDFIKCKINGATTFTTFNENISVAFDNTPGMAGLSVEGESSASTSFPTFGLAILNSTGVITNTTYTVNQIFSGIGLGAYYQEVALMGFSVQSDATTQTPAFTVTISTITATTITGTFFGPLKDNDGAGPGLKTITEGSFSVTR